MKHHLPALPSDYFFASSPDLLATASSEAILSTTNPAWTTALGFSSAKLSGKKLTELFQKCDHKAATTALKAAVTSQSETTFSGHCRCQDGTFRYIDWSFYGKEDVLYLRGRDNTKRRQETAAFERSLRLQSAHLELMQSPDLGIDGLLNKALEQIIAVTLSELGFLFLYDEQQKDFVLHAWSKSVLQACSASTNGDLPFSIHHRGLWSEAVRKQKTVIVNQYDPTAEYAAGYPPGHLPIYNFLSLPVLDHGRVVAIAGVANKETDYTTEDSISLERLMNFVWTRLERTRNEMLFAREHSLFWATLFSIHEGIITTDPSGQITLMNQSAEELTKYPMAEAAGKPLLTVFNAHDTVTREKITDPLWHVLETRQPKTALSEKILIRRDGSELHITGSISPAIDNKGQILGTVINFHDISSFWRKQQQDEYLLNHDTLTGAYNRQFFEKKVRQEIDHAENSGDPLSMVLLDLDNFKDINDTWGHPVGDSVLQHLVKVVNGLIRKSDSIIRLGGEEFIVLLPRTALKNALTAAEKLRSVLEASPHETAGKITASFGVAEHLSQEDFSEWYTRVDAAMYQAKKAGRNCVVSAEAPPKPQQEFLQLVWQPQWECGHPEIDRQHRLLVEYGNQLLALAICHNDPAALDAHLDKLLAHVAHHFNCEVDLLKEIGYPAHAQHTATHQKLIDEAIKLKENYHTGTLRSSAFFAFVVDDIIVGHMLNEDIKFFPYMSPPKH